MNPENTGEKCAVPTCCRRAGLVVAGLLLASLVVIWFAPPIGGKLPEMAAFAGRFHVVLLHFPIGLLAVAALLSLSSRRLLGCCLPATPPGVVVWLTGAGALSAWLAAMLGWLLANSGGYEGEAVQRHANAGIACAALALVAWFLAQHWAARAECHLRYAGMVAALMVTNGMVLLAGHLGGTLTHGEHFLWEAGPEWVRRMAGMKQAQPAPKSAALGEQPVYEEVIAPMLKQYCVECHNEQKAKGGLRMDHYAGVLESLKPGKPAESELLRRIALPLEDEDHMPPKGKPQPKPAEIAVLEWWIVKGAAEKTPVRELNPPATVRQQLGFK